MQALEAGLRAEVTHCVCVCARGVCSRERARVRPCASTYACASRACACVRGYSGMQLQCLVLGPARLGSDTTQAWCTVAGLHSTARRSGACGRATRTCFISGTKASDAIACRPLRASRVVCCMLHVACCVVNVACCLSYFSVV
jgi:hypothetical protein